jgi:hypothetical protein
LTNRWGILQKPLKVPLRKAPRIVECCMCLHNLLVDFNVPLTPPARVGVRRNERDLLARFEYDCTKMLNNKRLRQNSSDTSDMTVFRDKLKKRMCELKMKRPAVPTDSFRVMNASCLW